MFNYFKGIVNSINANNNRYFLILEVNNIGYEIQVPSRFTRQLESNSDQIISVFTHFQVRDDQYILYGFENSAQRDLFRQLISVSGVGAQTAIALIDTLGLEDLVQAIVTGNIRLLSKTPGIGQKTAERIALELKTKLAQWRVNAGVRVDSGNFLPSEEIMADLEMTLLALGYTNNEIQQAISVISQDNLLQKNPHVEEWIRSAIAFLSLN